MPGLGDISGGRADYNNVSPAARSLFDDIAARAVQTQSQDFPMLPAPFIQGNPFGNLAWRMLPGPQGQMAAQPLMGFPSRYPHVLNGYATGTFMDWMPMMQMMAWPFMMQAMQGRQQAQQQQAAPTPAKPKAAGTKTTGGGTATPAQVGPEILMAEGGPYYDKPLYELPVLDEHIQSQNLNTTRGDPLEPITPPHPVVVTPQALPANPNNFSLHDMIERSLRAVNPNWTLNGIL